MPSWVINSNKRNNIKMIVDRNKFVCSIYKQKLIPDTPAPRSFLVPLSKLRNLVSDNTEHVIKKSQPIKTIANI